MLYVIGEREDVAAKMPAEAARLRKQFDKYLADVGAQLPTHNPAFDPSALTEERPRKGGKSGMRKQGKKPGGKQAENGG